MHNIVPGTYSARQKRTIRQKRTKVGPKTSRKEPPDSVMARDVRSITGRGFQIVLSRRSAEETFPFISAFEVLRIRTWRTCGWCEFAKKSNAEIKRKASSTGLLDKKFGIHVESMWPYGPLRSPCLLFPPVLLVSRPIPRCALRSCWVPVALRPAPTPP